MGVIVSDLRVDAEVVNSRPTGCMFIIYKSEKGSVVFSESQLFRA